MSPVWTTEGPGKPNDAAHVDIANHPRDLAIGFEGFVIGRRNKGHRRGDLVILSVTQDYIADWVGAIIVDCQPGRSDLDYDRHCREFSISKERLKSGERGKQCREQ